MNFTDPSGLILNPNIETPHWDPWADSLFWRYMFWTPDTGGSPVGDPGGPGGDSGEKTVPSPEGKVNGNCTFPGFGQLSAAQQALFGKNGGGIYDRLSDTQRANFLNITGALSKTGIDISGLSFGDVGGIGTERLLFAPGAGITALQSSTQARINGGTFVSSRPLERDHPGMSDFGARQGVTRWSLQVGTGARGAFADIDPWGPVDVVGTMGHLVDYVKHRIVGGQTNPFAVGRGLSSKVTGYTCP